MAGRVNVSRGVFAVRKPAGITSAAVTTKLRGILEASDQDKTDDGGCMSSIQSVCVILSITRCRGRGGAVQAEEKEMVAQAITPDQPLA